MDLTTGVVLAGVTIACKWGVIVVTTATLGIVVHELYKDVRRTWRKSTGAQQEYQYVWSNHSFSR